MALQLVNQYEAPTPDSEGRYLGFERFYDKEEGYWSARFHCRTYDGIKVKHSWSTDLIRLEGDTPEQAKAAMHAAYRDFINVYRIASGA
jgi:hypothetical protein